MCEDNARDQEGKQGKTPSKEALQYPNTISTEPSKLFIFAAVNSSTHKVYFASYEVLHF